MTAAEHRLLCVPGLGLDDRAWRPTLGSLTGHEGPGDHRVALLAGFGRRPARGQDVGPAVLGARLAEGLDARTGPIVLLGHSASGQVVTHAAALAPERVSALVLVGPTTDPRAATWPRLAGRWLRTAGWERPGQVPVLARTYTRTGLPGMRRTMDAARREDVRESLRAVRCPVLVVRGRHDRICPQDWADELAALSPAGSRTLTLTRGAHMVPLTHGDLLATAVREFLQTLAPGSPAGRAPDR